MNASVLFLHAGDSERVAEMAAAVSALGVKVVVEVLATGAYDRILDAVAAADSVVCWPAGSAD